MKGIQDLIRPCATLARYEAALAAGTITQDVMVFIADVRQIRWKGEIYDCSVTAVTEEGKTFVHADGLNDSNDAYFYLPGSAPADDPAHTFAMLSDLQGAGGGDTEELEAVAAAGLVDLNERLLHLQDELFLYAGKKDIAEVQQVLTDALLENEEILAGALTDHETRIKESEKRISDCITRYENNLQAAKTTEEIESNEKVVAYAMVEVKTIVEDLKKRIYQLENRL